MKLFEPLVIRGMTLKNRIVMPPMNVRVGYRGDRARAYYGERAKGGVAAITLAATSADLFVSDDAWGSPGGVAAFLQAANSLVEIVHRAGAKIGVQLWYGNRYPAGKGAADTRGAVVAPSSGGDARALTILEIQEIISRFARAAARTKECGFDYVEVHGAHNTLLCQFLSAASNRRTDAYGGDLAGRVRAGTECVKAIRRAVGENFPIFYRLGVWEDKPNGITIDQGAEFAAALERAGADVLDISTGETTGPDMSPPEAAAELEGILVSLAAAVKQKVSLPVIAVGRIKTRAFAESVLADGKADLVAIGRQLIADPYWPEKVAEGREDDIVPCIGCNVCFDSGRMGLPLSCPVNPSVTGESHMLNKEAQKKEDKQ